MRVRISGRSRGFWGGVLERIEFGIDAASMVMGDEMMKRWE
jgi:hypothetical protein